MIKQAENDLGQNGKGDDMAKQGGKDGQYKVKTTITGNQKADDLSSVIKKGGAGGGAGAQKAGKHNKAGKQRAAG